MEGKRSLRLDEVAASGLGRRWQTHRGLNAIIVISVST